MNSNAFNKFRSVFAHVLLVILSFMCLFFFYILFINFKQPDCLRLFRSNLYLFFFPDGLWAVCLRF